MATYKVYRSYWAYANMNINDVHTGRVVPGKIVGHTVAGSWIQITEQQEGAYGVVLNKFIPFKDPNSGSIIAEVDQGDPPKAVDENGEEMADNAIIDDSFTQLQNPNGAINNDSYLKDLTTNGLRVKDLRGILGLPHQFLPTTDPRIDGTDSNEPSSFGRIYAEKIIKPMPLLLLTPGTPSFMSSFSSDQKKTMLEKFLGTITEGDLNSLVNENSGKYYSLKYAYTDYFQYVNAMLRSAAYFLGIEHEKIDGKELGQFNWLYYQESDSQNTDIFGHEGLGKFLGTYAGCIPLYVDAGYSVDDSFSNSTTQSQLAGTLDTLSDAGRELNFLIGNVGGMAGLQLDKLTGQEDLLKNIQNVNDSVNDLLGKGNIVSNIMSKAQTILAGGRMLFPEIWSDSSFSRSYSCKMKLVSPSGDKLSVYLNILVPIMFLLGFVLPRQSSGQAFFSPFLCRGYCKGLFNIDMGIFVDLNVTKGDEGEWTTDGIPTVAEVSFTIKDLYDGMFMSSGTDLADLNILSNITELDYIANSCGININETAIWRTIRMGVSLGLVGNIKDRVSLRIFSGIGQYFNNKLNDIFGKF